MNLYWQAVSPYLLPALVAFGLTFLFTRLALYFFPKWGLMDRPHLYGLNRSPIPYTGGLILFAVFLVCAVLFMNWDKHLIGVVLAASMILLVSFVDDRRGLSPFFRLGVQILAALTIIIAGIGIDAITNPFGGIIALDTYQIPVEIQGKIYNITLLADLFTLFWIVAMINTVNWLDGLPGLVSGISIIGSVVMFILSIRPNFHSIDQGNVSLLAAIIAGMAFAFWWFDFSPPKILMGDTGSMFLGFLLAVLAIFSGAKIATAFLIMGFPLLDFFWVILRRLFQGRSPFKGDLYHFHHRLLRAGLTQRQSIILIYIISALFGGMALFLNSHAKLIAILTMIGLMLVLGTFVVVRANKVKS